LRRVAAIWQPSAAAAPPGSPRHQAALRRDAPSGSFRLAVTPALSAHRPLPHHFPGRDPAAAFVFELVLARPRFGFRSIGRSFIVRSSLNRFVPSLRCSFPSRPFVTPLTMPSPRRRRCRGKTPQPLSPHMEATSAAAASATTAPSPCVVRLPTSSPAPVDCANVDPATIPIPPSPSLDARMDLPPLRVPLFVPEPDTQASAATAAASSAGVELEASHHNPANVPDAVLRQQKLAGLAEWRTSIVARVGAATAAAILVDVDTALPAIVDDPSVSLQELNVTCGALNELLIEMAATYFAPNRSLSLLQASLDRTAARLAGPSTPSPVERPSSRSPPPRLPIQKRSVRRP
ncbi:MAG: hypothetical protein BJ554DRAFT_2735, partial [Olpidium bornovanus]